MILGAVLQLQATESIIVIMHAEDGLVVAADSRQIDEETGATSDTACKILPLGDKMIFAAVGQELPVPEGSDGRGLEWIYSEARLAFKQVQSQKARDPDANPVEDVALAWKDAIQAVLEETFFKHPDSFVQMPRNGYLLRGVFGGLDPKGDVSLLEVSVKPKHAPKFEVLTGHIASGPQLAHVALGNTDILDEFTRARTDRARTEAAQQERELANLDSAERAARTATRLVDLTIGLLSADHAALGGAIDLLELRRNGEIHWRQRKDICTK